MPPLVYYVRDHNHTPVATIAGVRVDGENNIGVAVCHVNDTPVKRIGREVAIGRAIKGVPTDIPKKFIMVGNGDFYDYVELGDEIEIAVNRMNDRLNRYHRVAV